MSRRTLPSRPATRSRAFRVAVAALVLSVGVSSTAFADDAVAPDPAAGTPSAPADPGESPTAPAEEPTSEPTEPTAEPTVEPTAEPTAEPTITPEEPVEAPTTGPDLGPPVVSPTAVEEAAQELAERAPGAARAAVVPWSCSPQGILFQGVGGGVSQYSFIELGDGSEDPRDLTDRTVNAVGYNALDDYVYGTSRAGENHIVRIDSVGGVTDLGDLRNPDGSVVAGYASVVGDVDEQGFYWTFDDDGRTVRKIRLTGGPPTVVTEVDEPRPAIANGGADWAFIAATGRFWQITEVNGQQALLGFDRATLTWTNPIILRTPPPVPNAQPNTGNVGAVFTDGTYLYASHNSTGGIYRVNVLAADPAQTYSHFANGPQSSINDGARCARAAVPIDFGDAPASYGTSLETNDGARHSVVAYDIGTKSAPLKLGATVDIEGNGVPSAAATGDDVVNPNAPGGQVDDEDGIVSGPVLRTPGQPTTIRVRATNNDGNPATLAAWLDNNADGVFDGGELQQRAVPNGTNNVEYTLTFPASASTADTYLRLRLARGTTPVGPTGGATGGEVEDYPVAVRRAVITDSKTVTPGSGTPVGTGQTLTYRLNFQNTGNIPGPVARADDLTGVIDDATPVGLPTKSGTGAANLNIGGSLLSGRLTFTGNLDPGDNVTVEYVVQVKAPADRGDSLLTNALVDANQTAPPCPAAGAEDCTSNTSPAIQDSKTVIPGSGTPVGSGQTLTYRLNFRNTGTAPGLVARDDDLSDVIDDATPVGTPVVTGVGAGRLTIAGTLASGRLVFGGTLLPDDDVTVEYVVQVNAPGLRRNSLLTNALVDRGQTAPPCPATGAEDCTRNTSPRIIDSKTVTPGSGTPVGTGQTLTYTLRFQNTGTAPGLVAREDDLSDVIDDATPGGAPVVTGVGAGRLTVAGTLASGRLTFGGTLEPDDDVTVTYTVTVRAPGARGNSLLLNALVDPGQNAGPCPAGAEDCTTNTVPRIIDSKTVTPGSGTPVGSGQTLTYTLRFQNTGSAPGPVAREDDLSGVIDDATPGGAPVVTGVGAGRLTVTGTLASGRLTFGGTLDPGDDVTVTYTVQVRAPGSRGDSLLTNALVDPGQNAGPCPAAGAEDCTTNPSPEIQDSKTVTPGSGTPVGSGQTLTYTLRFQNTGSAPGLVAREDDLSGVIDDATPIGAPVVTGVGAGRLTVAGTLASGRLTFGGTLEPDDDVTVTYTVQVKAPGSRGDSLLLNALVDPGQNAGPCPAAGAEDCTSNTSPAIQDSKTVTPGSGTPVGSGQTLTYTLRFQNTGTAPGLVARDDDLSDVIDDATPIGTPVVTGVGAGRLTVAGTLASGRLTFGGTLEPDDDVTVTYTVQVDAPGSRGNNQLSNALVDRGQAAPPCAPAGGEDCTSNPMPELLDSKSVDPTDGTRVLAGQVVTYTLSFANNGTAPATVARDDVLTDVLDDADPLAGPTITGAGAAGLTATIAGNRLSVTGSLAPRTAAEVTYSVTVRPDGARGNNSLGNVLVDAGVVPTGPCAVGDGDCTTNGVPEVVDSKIVDPTDGTAVLEGQLVTYTLRFANNGTAAGDVAKQDVIGGVLDDAELVTGPTVGGPDAAGLTVSPIAAGRFSVTGTLPAGGSAEVTYTVRVLPAGQRGDNTLANALVLPGDPAPTCAAGDPDCTVNLMAELVDSKSVDPTDGTQVDTGDVVTYTLTFANTGTAAGDVAKDDVLTDVLDDADLVSGPTVSDPALSAPYAAGRIAVRGTLQRGQTVTVEYAVRVRPVGQRGNNQLGNVLIRPGDTVATCAAGDPDCTLNPMPELVESKISAPASGTTVLAGQELTYTLRFANTGTAPGAVAQDDVLSGVLDDAVVIQDPTATTATGTLGVSPITAGRFSVTGTLQPGDVVEVTYRVRIKPDGQRGDNLLGNYLVRQGDNPPTQCLGDDCTVSFIPELVDDKTVDPVDGTRVLPGDLVTYTLTFRNIGTGAGDLAKEDAVANVLDDAELVTPPTSSDPAVLAVSAITDGRFAITGSLPAGAVVTVTYTVRVLPDADRVAAGGNSQLDNYLVLPGEAVTGCPAGNPDCTVNGIPLVRDSKAAVPADGDRLLPGDEVTYTLTFRNDGTADGDVAKQDVVSDVVDDADITSPPTSSDPALTVSPIADGRFSVTGSLVPGQVVTVAYTAVVLSDEDRTTRGGNDALRNYLVSPGGVPTACVPAEEDCTFHGVPRLVDSKSVTPSDGTTVLQGDQVTYTLTFGNLGQAPGDVAKEDVVSGVLDDARLVTPPTSSDPALTVSPIADGRFSVTGSLPAGATVTVTYTVEVLPDDDRVAGGGDDLLGNALVLPGATPAACVPGEPDCTVNTIPRLVDRKDTDVADGTVVLQGDEVTYTLTFANEGTGPGDLARDDDLVGVLDDAELVTGPTVSDPALTATLTGTRLAVTGTLQADQVVTVTYTVRVRPDDDRVAGGGDDQLVNALLDPGEVATPCAVGDPDCTVQPIPRLVDSKSVDVGDETVVLAGDEVTYTLTFANEGTGAGDLARDDDLSDVLDDAELVSGPTASDPALTPSLAGERLSVTGTLQPDQVVTVTYTVRVLPDAERFAQGGDDRLRNALLDPGEVATPCVTGDPDCVVNGIPRLTDGKQVSSGAGSVVLPGERLTYELTFANEGQGAGDVAKDDDLSGVLDDATLVAPPVSSDPALTVSPITDGRFSVTGTLQPGQSVTVSYVVEVLPDADRVAAGGDDQLLNFLLLPGEEPGEACPEDGRTTRRAGYEGIDCTTSPIPRLVQTKTVDPRSGSAVKAGDVLTYTLGFVNEGKGAGDLEAIDDLTHVVDDARLVDRPASSDPALTVSDIRNRRFAVRGTLQAAQRVEVTYTVEVLPDGRRGDDVIGNFLLAPGEPTPAGPDCDPTSPTCTVTYASEIRAAKSVDPRSGSRVEVGQELTYTLVLRNDGAGPGRVTWDDDLGDVLDDAELVGEPVVTGADGRPAETVQAVLSGSTLRLRGRLEARERVEVTYVVRVSAPGTGDGQLLNFLAPTGVVSGGECVAATRLCTTNPVTPVTPVVPPDTSGDGDGGDGSGGGLLPGTGGPALGLLGLGASLLLLGLSLLAGRRRRTAVGPA